MNLKTVAIHTLGCKVNGYESEAMKNLFELNGYQEVDFKEKADVYVINTCTVTNTGDSKSRQIIRRACRQNPNAIVCVVGCYSQVAKEEVAKIEGVDIVLGTRYRKDIMAYIKEYELHHKQIVDIDDVMELTEFEEIEVPKFSHTRAYLKIQDGCNNFCTFCIIPYARGRLRSRDKDQVLKQARLLVKAGYCEIVLTGIHTSGYGEDLDDYKFYDLLKDLEQIEGLLRIRISSIEISQVTDEIIDLISKSKVIVHHLHVPLQAGSDKILRKMARKYDTQKYLAKINQIKAKIPDITFTTDVIVGFPQETDQDFQDACDFIEKIGYFHLHVFPYSMRTGTPAAKMSGQINGKVKQERVHRLMEISNKSANRIYQEQVGKTLRVIFEKGDDGYYCGHSDGYHEVRVKSDQDIAGQIKFVKITKYTDMLEGMIVA